MLHVLWLILKILLLIEAGLLGFLLLILALVLLVPVRYRGHVRKEEGFQAEGELSWLLRLVWVPVKLEGDGISAKLKILCFTVKDLLAEEEAVEQKTVEALPAAETLQQPQSRPRSDPDKQPERKAAEKPESEHSEVSEHSEAPERKQSLWKRIRIFLLAIRIFLKRLAGKLRNLKYTIHRFCVKIKRMKRFVGDDRTKAAFILAWAQVKRLLGKLLPKKLRGNIYFGTGDPALTGELLGAAAIFYPLYGTGVQVTPDFEETVLRGELFVEGRLRMVTLVQIVWKLFWDKNIRFVYAKFNG